MWPADAGNRSRRHGARSAAWFEGPGGKGVAVKIGLVLGAGGTVGMAYHAGVLRALREVGGFAAEDADLVVGTSAGSVVGAYLRSGWTTEDFWHLALGTHAELEALTGS